MLEVAALLQIQFYGTKWQLRNGCGFRWVTLPGILFINIRCQSRLEGNNSPAVWCQEINNTKNIYFCIYLMKTKNIHLSPVVQIFKNEQGVAHQQVDGIYFAGQYRRLSFSSRKTKRTNLRAVNASARLCWYLFTSLYLRW